MSNRVGDDNDAKEIEETEHIFITGLKDLQNNVMQF